LIGKGYPVTRNHPYRIVFIRHGETAFNASGRLQGQRDIPLNARGREQASSVGRFLRDSFGAEMARLDAAGAFWASPLRRTRETMELARGAMGLAPQGYKVDVRLEELTFGTWEGLTWAEVERVDPAGLAARKADKWGFAPPDGESYASLTKRVATWLGARDGDCFIAGHGGTARALMVLIAGVSPEVADNAEIFQGRVMVLDKGAFAWVG
jgi:broad specificity phosphatase PhoE